MKIPDNIIITIELTILAVILIFMAIAVPREQAKRSAMPERDYCMKYYNNSSQSDTPMKCIKYFRE